MRRIPLALAFVIALGGVAGAACGDRVLDPGEQCDDGNTLKGDCCSDTCQFEPAGASCDDRSMCTIGDVCDGAGKCVGTSRLSCDDHNPCTLESCKPMDGCHHDPVDFTATLAQFGSLTTGDCARTRLPASLKGAFVAAGKLVARGQSTASPGGKKRFVERAAGQLVRANGAVNKLTKHRPKSISAACATALHARVITARSRTQCLLKTL